MYICVPWKCKFLEARLPFQVSFGELWFRTALQTEGIQCFCGHLSNYVVIKRGSSTFCILSDKLRICQKSLTLTKINKKIISQSFPFAFPCCHSLLTYTIRALLAVQWLQIILICSRGIHVATWDSEIRQVQPHLTEDNTTKLNCSFQRWCESIWLPEGATSILGVSTSMLPSSSSLFWFLPNKNWSWPLLNFHVTWSSILSWHWTQSSVL